MRGNFLKTILILVIIFGASFYILQFYISEISYPLREAEKIEKSSSSLLPEKTTSSLFYPVETEDSTTTVSAPLIISQESAKIADLLKKEKIISFTNFYRIEEKGLELKENEILNKAAEQKLNDMFEKQYFEHISPDGTDASAIVKSLGYQYLKVGENLALGNFKDEKELVDGWMGSPGHKANILNPAFLEIGVAAKKDLFEGRELFIAVQIFASPLSECSIPDESLKREIEQKQTILDNLQSDIDDLKSEIEALQTEEGNIDLIQEKIQEYNNLVSQINFLDKEIQSLISTYNSQVVDFNECARK